MDHIVLFAPLRTSGFWLILGAILIGLEFVLPGFVSVFLGVAAVVTGSALGASWITDSSQALALFLLASLFLLLVVRTLVARFLPAHVVRSETDETQQAIGRKVRVVESFSDASVGRISYLGTTWQARLKAGIIATIQVGKEVTIVGQENITFLVEPSRFEPISKD